MSRNSNKPSNPIRAYAALSLPREGSVWRNIKGDYDCIVLPYKNYNSVNFLCMDGSEENVDLYYLHDHYRFVSKAPSLT